MADSVWQKGSLCVSLSHTLIHTHTHTHTHTHAHTHTHTHTHTGSTPAARTPVSTSPCAMERHPTPKYIYYVYMYMYMYCMIYIYIFIYIYIYIYIYTDANFKRLYDLSWTKQFEDLTCENEHRHVPTPVQGHHVCARRDATVELFFFIQREPLKL